MLHGVVSITLLICFLIGVSCYGILEFQAFCAKLTSHRSLYSYRLCWRLGGK